MALLIPEYLQTKTYSALRVRGVLMDSGIQEGVVDGPNMKVTQRAAGGANMSVDIAEGAAFVKGDLTSRQGLYHVYNDALSNIAIGLNSSGNPRVDQIICRVLDSQDGLAGADMAQFEVLPGTATAGANLTNRNGAATLPLTAMRVADVLVASGASSITNASIRDRRPWAHGLNKSLIRNSGDVVGFNFLNFTSFDSASFYVDGEFSGGPVDIEVAGAASGSAVMNFFMIYSLDSDFIGTNFSTSRVHFVNFSAASTVQPLNRRWKLPAGAIPAGRHRLDPAGRVNTANLMLLSSTGNGQLEFSVREHVRQDTDNR